MQTILFQGDSITDAIRCRENDHYRGSGYATLVTAELARRSPGQVRCLNRGVSGDKVVDVLARMKHDILNLRPDVMSLLIGVNDVWAELDHQGGVSVPLYEQTLELLLRELRRVLPDTRVMLLQPFVLEGRATRATEDQPDRWEQFRTGVAERAEAMARIAVRYDLPCISLQADFNDLARRYGTDWLVEDGVHPTIAGHSLIAQRWLEAYDRL